MLELLCLNDTLRAAEPSLEQCDERNQRAQESLKICEYTG